ncbi:MAG: DUF938 domain-containing protein [Thiohalospira sp.]
MKPYAESAEQNREPILAVIREVFTAPGTVLEVGSGTGQHAVAFAGALPHLTWLTSDQRENHPGIRQWLAEAGLPNTREPLAIDTREPGWEAAVAGPVDGLFSANTVHIMDWPAVEGFFAGAGRLLAAEGAFCLYGPFSRGGEHNAASNAEFDAFLRQRDEGSGVRDLDDLEALAAANGLYLAAEHPMPADNRTLVWRRAASS